MHRCPSSEISGSEFQRYGSACLFVRLRSFWRFCAVFQPHNDSADTGNDKGARCGQNNDSGDGMVKQGVNHGVTSSGFIIPSPLTQAGNTA